MTAQAIGEIVEEGGIGAIVGPAALGKTFAISQTLESHVGDVVRVTFDTSPTPKFVADRLMVEMTGRRAGRTKFEISDEMLSVLAEKQRLLVIGEAQNLNRACFEILRYLHDSPNTQFALLFDGGDGAWDVLKGEPMLHSRIDRRVWFAPLDTHEVADLIPTYHPIYADTDRDLVLAVDKAFARGRLREWASSPAPPRSSATS
jgi:DNA transposition AAA+ family ATPase